MTRPNWSKAQLVELGLEWATQLAVWDGIIFGPDAFSVLQIEQSYRHVHNFYFGLDLNTEESDAPEIAGYAALRILSGEAEILSLGVLPQYRSQHLGEELGNQLCRKLRELGARTVFLEVRESNQPALGLYRKLGFTEIAKRKNYYHNPRENALVMEKRLASESPGPIGSEVTG